ncbi:MAG: acetoacetyl-coenzyme A synthetase [Geminicoccaceae bacterium]|nr:MAG: acetoacetyl-coenzyme A synthetase [Geminicoccaceae bacterium]
MTEPIWRPDPERAARTQIVHFAAQHGFTGEDAIRELWHWSVEHPEPFWRDVWKSFGVIASEEAERVLENPDAMPGARWFPGARLNFAQNLLRRRDDVPAIIFVGEDGRRRELSWRELWNSVERLAAAFRSRGIGLDDRVAGYLPNIPETIVAMLATSAVGAVWSSCSPDFGVRGVLDRFGQIEPKLLITVDGYLYGGKRIDVREKVAAVAAELKTVENVVVVPFLEDRPHIGPIPKGVLFEDFLGRGDGSLRFEQLPFDFPLYVLYSSGTTGMPKAIVHGQGGTLLQHLKEHRLHCDLRPGDRLFYYTTCGWMMWNWLASGLASEATLVLYDGSPFHPGPEVLWDLAQRERITIFGTSAKYLQALEKSGAAPIATHDLGSLKAILSTGSPLLAESFDYVYRKIKTDVHLASISGGTDIVSCFVLGNPAGPVWRGEIQMRGLGMAVDVFDEHGRPVRGQRGELVCTKPFPSMPIGFWNDPDGSRYRKAYFERFPNVWCHGDWAELTEHDGIVIYGRSDAVLNPGGVRIGTAEIYRQVEQIDEVLESVCVGQDWEGDVRIVLFVKLRDGLVLDDALRERIRRRIRENTTPRHVPAKIIQVADIPRTMSGKITELAVRDVIHGRPVKNTEALANPSALDLFRDLPELKV